MARLIVAVIKMHIVFVKFCYNQIMIIFGSLGLIESMSCNFVISADSPKCPDPFIQTEQPSYLIVLIIFHCDHLKYSVFHISYCCMSYFVDFQIIYTYFHTFKCPTALPLRNKGFYNGLSYSSCCSLCISFQHYSVSIT